MKYHSRESLGKRRVLDSCLIKRLTTDLEGYHDIKVHYTFWLVVLYDKVGFQFREFVADYMDSPI